MLFSFYARAKDNCCRKHKVCLKSCLHFGEENVKSLHLGIHFCRKMFSYDLQFTWYLYDVNWKNNLFFKFLRTVDFKAILKNCIFEKNLTDFENRLKNFYANENAF